MCYETRHSEGRRETGGEHSQGATAVHHQVIQREHPEKYPHVQGKPHQEVDRNRVRHHEKRVQRKLTKHLPRIKESLSYILFIN